MEHNLFKVPPQHEPPGPGACKLEILEKRKQKYVRITVYKNYAINRIQQAMLLQCILPISIFARMYKKKITWHNRLTISMKKS